MSLFINKLSENDFIEISEKYKTLTNKLIKEKGFSSWETIE
jgi:hypothetical protein